MSKKTVKKTLRRKINKKERAINKLKSEKVFNELAERLNKRYLADLLGETSVPGTENPVESKKKKFASKRRRNRSKKSLDADKNNKEMTDSEKPVENVKSSSTPKKKMEKSKSFGEDESNEQEMTEI